MLELQALLSSSVAAFMLGRGDIGGPEMAAAFLAARSAMKKALRRWEVPMIGTVATDGHVSMLYLDGARLRQPRRVVP